MYLQVSAIIEAAATAMPVCSRSVIFYFSPCPSALLLVLLCTFINKVLYYFTALACLLSFVRSVTFAITIFLFLSRYVY